MTTIRKERTSFGTLLVHDEYVVESIVDEGEHVTRDKIDEWFVFLKNSMNEDFSLILNRANNYSFDTDLFSKAKERNLKELLQVNRMQSLAIYQPVFLTEEDTVMFATIFQSLGIRRTRLFLRREQAVAWSLRGKSKGAKVLAREVTDALAFDVFSSKCP